MKTIRSFVLWWLAASILLVSAVRAQGTAVPAGATAAPPPFTAQELDAMLAPIALYPDGLLSQVLMAATYPLEVVQAARWSKANPDLKGDEAVKKVGKESWDVSVMSLVAFPNVLEMMNKELERTAGHNVGHRRAGDHAHKARRHHGRLGRTAAQVP